MNILSLDLASKTGWAHGNAGEPQPASGCERLKARGEPHYVAVANLIRFLGRRFSITKPDHLVKEEMLSIAGMLKLRNSHEHIELQCALHNAAVAVAHLWKVPIALGVQPATVRKYFLGKSSFGFKGMTPAQRRAETKLAVIRRCHLLGIMPLCQADDNQADALSIWYWAYNTLAYRPLD